VLSRNQDAIFCFPHGPQGAMPRWCSGIDVEGLNIVGAMHVHATPCETVFAPWLIAYKLSLPL